MNKNQKQLRIRIRRAGLAGNDTCEYTKPVRDYHSARRTNAGQLFVTQQFPTARCDGDGVNSRNSQRNSCQRVYRNQGAAKAGNTSATFHEPFVKYSTMAYPNHGYIEYNRRGAASNALPAVTA